MVMAEEKVDVTAQNLTLLMEVKSDLNLADLKVSTKVPRSVLLNALQMENLLGLQELELLKVQMMVLKLGEKFEERRLRILYLP